MSSNPMNTKPNTDGSPSTGAGPSFGELVFKLMKNFVLLVARFYVMCLLIAYEWISKMVAGALKPLEPIAEQVKKVPKKDVSLEGIFYQLLRLQFIVVLYVAPFVQHAFSYITQPLSSARKWAVMFVDSNQGKAAKTTDTE